MHFKNGSVSVFSPGNPVLLSSFSDSPQRVSSQDKTASEGGSCSSLRDKENTKLTCGLTVQGRWRQQCLSDMTIEIIHVAFLEILPLISLVCITYEASSPRSHKFVLSRMKTYEILSEI